jgi:hypothetical protein
MDTKCIQAKGESGISFFPIKAGSDLDASWRAGCRWILCAGHGPVRWARRQGSGRQKRYFVVMRDEVAKLIAPTEVAKEIEKLKFPKEFAHYKRVDGSSHIIKLYYNQLMTG